MVAPQCDNGFSLTGRDPDSLPYEVYTPDEFFVLVDGRAGPAGAPIWPAR
ncbi:hypothetical protein ACFQ68_37100 [Amycolatopsis japonica]